MPAALRFASVTAVALDDFEAALIPTGETDIFVRRAGSGPPLLLLHGFPQTHLMWRDVAPRLASRYTVVCADLRGYGQSGCPASTPDHAPYAKRAMAADMVTAMARLGFDRSGSRWPATTVAAASPTGSRSTIRGASTASRCSTCPDRRSVDAGRRALRPRLLALGWPSRHRCPSACWPRGRTR